VPTRGTIFAVLGPSGCGKTALIEETLRRFPRDLAIMRSLTTRQRRPTDDDRSTRFVSSSEFLELRDAGSLIQWTEYDGNLYGDTVEDVEGIVGSGAHAIRPLVEESVQSFRAKGYEVVVIRIVPTGTGYKNRSRARELLDEERSRSNEYLRPDVEIVNLFDTGGFDDACLQLEGFIGRRIRD
jgi:guanylate kinase